MSQDLQRFMEIFGRATQAISKEFIQLPVAGKEDPIYRERVYCYELYHCLRNEMASTGFSYSLSGELDKSGHPLIHGDSLDYVKPDLLVHKPGDMDNNLVVIEVKPANADNDGIAKDLKCLTAFRRSAKYVYAIYLIYGNEPRKFQHIQQVAN